MKELLERTPRQAGHVLTFLPDAIRYFTALIDYLASPTQLQVNKVRPAVRGLLGKEILLHPMADGTARYLTTELSGNYSGLLREKRRRINLVEGTGVEPATPTLRT